MISDKSSRNKAINGMLLVLCVSVSLLITSSVAFATEAESSEPFNPTLTIVVGWILAVVAAYKNPRIGLLLSAFFGTIIAGYLGYQHYSMDPGFCGSGCQELNLKNGKLSNLISGFPDYPIAYLGLSFYLGLIVLTVTEFKNSENYKLAGQFAFMFSIIGVIAAIVMAGVSLSLGKWCKYCIGMYGYNVICFFAAFLWQRREAGGSRMDALFGKNDKSMMTTLVSFGFGVVLLGMFFNTPPSNKNENSTLDPKQKIDLQSSSPVPMDGTEPVLGDKSARFTLVEFADFQCGACGEATPVIKGFVKELEPHVKLVFKHFAFLGVPESGCEVGDQGVKSCVAAVAADCAHEQGRFWEMSEMIFKLPEYLDDKNIERMASKIRLDLTVFRECFSKFEVKGANSDIEAGKSAGVKGTPSVFLHDSTSDKWYKVQDYNYIPRIVKQLDPSIEAQTGD